MTQIGKIMVPTDGSPIARKAEEMAITLAKASGGEVVFVHILPTSVLLMPRTEENVALEVKEWEADAEEDVGLSKIHLRNAIEAAQEAGIKASARLYRTTYSTREAICDVADGLRIDLIVIGTRGRSLKRIILGSVAVGVVTYAHCPVLVVR